MNKVTAKRTAFNAKRTNGFPFQDMPDGVSDETQSFVVSMAVSRERLLDILKNETVSLAVLGVRRIDSDDRDLLEDSDTRFQSFRGFESNRIG